ncbi:unnamed protein product [Paramecium sonneborni]|uniref:Uncharacterized protein n=1 Tax=Paramecium sonneborni TaxID=65129 RepID=A0A8S1RSV8_9CILI|nr:unnamed protein product [Paramecium sonneborni]
MNVILELIIQTMAINKFFSYQFVIGIIDVNGKHVKIIQIKTRVLLQQIQLIRILFNHVHGKMVLVLLQIIFFQKKTCFLNTDQTARWSSNNEDGYCIPCSTQFNQLLVPRNKCLCAQILTQCECNLANYYWNQGFCIQSGCPQIQLQCVQIAECYWLYDSNYSQGGSCKFILNPILPEFCTKPRGKNSLECLSQTSLCPVSIDGVCQSREHLQQASSLCNYVQMELDRKDIAKMKINLLQLTVQGECYLFDKACLSNVTSCKCEQMTCESYPQTNCSFVYQNIDRANIEICVWNGNSCSPASYLIKQDSFQQCYQTTGGTYH